ncbi:MAG: hypothetical protein JSS81_24170 [Acidobacteria bacterium]|nr:hypothetical protein [Acidobacteriota bacterium]
MKTLFKVLVLGVFFSAVGIVTSSAQDQPMCADLAACVDKFKAEFKDAKCGERDKALATAKYIVEKFGTDQDNQTLIEAIKKRIVLISDPKTGDPACKQNTRYDASYKAKNWADFFAVSKEIMAREGDSELGFDVLLDNLSVGFNISDRDKIDTYNNETLNYSKTVIQKLTAGKASKNFGIFEPFKTKESALTWAYYTAGYMTEKGGQKEAALPYYYKAMQAGPEKRDDPTILIKFGDYYFSKAADYDEKYRAIHAQNKANNVEDDDAAKKILGLAKGNADRSIDAFARARRALKSKTTTKPEVIVQITQKLGDLYRFRFNLAPDAKTPELETYVTAILAKELPDPASEVTPIIEEPKPPTPTTTTTNSTTTTSTPTTTTPSNTTTKPTTSTPTTSTPKASTTPTKPTSTTTTTPKTTSGTTEATTTKPTKPAPKKKGTR